MPDLPLLAGRAQDDRARGRPGIARRLAQDQDRIGPLAAHQPVDDIERHLQSADSAATISS